MLQAAAAYSVRLAPCAGRGRRASARRVRGTLRSPDVEAAPHPNPLPASVFARRRASADKRAGRGSVAVHRVALHPGHETAGSELSLASAPIAPKMLSNNDAGTDDPMPHPPQTNGERVLADLNALRAI